MLIKGQEPNPSSQNEGDAPEGAGEPEQPESPDELESLKKEHEAALAEERRRRETAERALAERNFKQRKQKREGQEEEPEEDEEKPLTASQLEGILSRERERTTKELMGSQIAEKARKIATSDTEAALIVEIHKNRTFPSYLTLEEQLEEAAAIANRRRIVAQNEELKRALAGKKGVQKSAGETGQRTPPREGEPNLPAQDMHAIKQAGYVWDGQAKVYKKPLAGSQKILFYDPVKKKRWTAVK